MHRFFLHYSQNEGFPGGKAYIIFAGSVEPFRVHHQRWWVSGKLKEALPGGSDFLAEKP